MNRFCSAAFAQVFLSRVIPRAYRRKCTKNKSGRENSTDRKKTKTECIATHRLDVTNPPTRSRVENQVVLHIAMQTSQ